MMVSSLTQLMILYREIIIVIFMVYSREIEIKISSKHDLMRERYSFAASLSQTPPTPPTTTTTTTTYLLP